MKEILLKIDNSIYTQLEQAMYLKHLTDNIAGLEDAFVVAILKAILANKKEILLEPPK